MYVTNSVFETYFGNTTTISYERNKIIIISSNDQNTCKIVRTTIITRDNLMELC